METHAEFCWAHNGWLTDYDPLQNFAELGSNVYIRRELIPWDDSVKLRYGSCPADAPFLWELMRRYTIETARIFLGVRLDNCHNTPLHVSEYMINEARHIRPDLYVTAELFTNSKHLDNIFVNRLGLTSLIREALIAWDTKDLGERLLNCGGKPIGGFFQPHIEPAALCSLPRAIFIDQTHDNPSPSEKRTALDALPNAAIVAMSCSAIGSNRGYDELVPHHISVLTEKRLYRTWCDERESISKGFVNYRTGIIAAKKVLNQLHFDLNISGFTEIGLEQIASDVLVVRRHNPVTHESVIAVVRTVFCSVHELTSPSLPSIKIDGTIEDIVMEALLTTGVGEPHAPTDRDYITGLSNVRLRIKEHIQVDVSDMAELDETTSSLKFVRFPQGSVIIIRTSVDPQTIASMNHLRRLLTCFGYKTAPEPLEKEKEEYSELVDIISKLSFNDLNRILYRSNPEEQDDGHGYGAYNIPGDGDLPYCGLQGVESILSSIRSSNDLGHPLCRNLVAGDWMLDYIYGRLLRDTGTRHLGEWLEHVTVHLKRSPRFLLPSYFDALITSIYMMAIELSWSKMSEFVYNGSTFVRTLALGSIQLCSVVKSAPLPQLSRYLAPPAPGIIFDADGIARQLCVTIAAGTSQFYYLLIC